MSEELLGRGIYDLVEVARLVRRTPDEVAGWATATRDDERLLIPSKGRLLAFYDLVTAEITAELRRREVPLSKIRDARRYLAAQYEVRWPLAHAASLGDLASVGRDVFVRPRGQRVAAGVRDMHAEADWVAASQGGQAAFQEVIKPLLKRIDFDVEGMASRWRPVKGVVIDPGVQAGAPCIVGTRLSTEIVAELAAAGESVTDIASDYELSLAAVRSALAYEHELSAA